MSMFRNLFLFLSHIRHNQVSVCLASQHQRIAAAPRGKTNSIIHIFIIAQQPPNPISDHRYLLLSRDKRVTHHTPTLNTAHRPTDQGSYVYIHVYIYIFIYMNIYIDIHMYTLACNSRRKRGRRV